MRELKGKVEQVAPISAPMLQMVAMPVAEMESTPVPAGPGGWGDGQADTGGQTRVVGRSRATAQVEGEKGGTHAAVNSRQTAIPASIPQAGMRATGSEASTSRETDKAMWMSDRQSPRSHAP